jgi:hypothetical protein
MLPALEIVRRWRQWPGPIETWPTWMDDFVIGAMLILAAWLSGPRGASSVVASQNAPHVRRSSWLTAAWGFACGAGFGSTLAQLNHVLNPPYDYNDPSGLAHGWVVLLKACLVGIGIIGLIASLREETS